MRIASLLPAATEIVCALGLHEELVGISHGCNYPPDITTRPRISAADIDYDLLDSKAIDAHVAKSMHERKSLYRLDKGLLTTLHPTHILTQALCDVCAITPTDVQKVIQDLPEQPAIIELNPRSLEGICEDVITLGTLFKRTEEARCIVKGLRTTIRAVQEKSQSLRQRTVFCLEWLDPLYACGHWVPEMVELAGGADPLSFPNQYSRTLFWQDVISVDPEVIILMPCSYPVEKTISELPTLTSLPVWMDLRAVRNNEVWVVDGGSYFNQSGIRTIACGIEILAKIIHPEVFGPPSRTEAVNISTLEITEIHKSGV